MEREQLEVDVVLVGAGPANLAAALHLTTLFRNAAKEGGNARGLQEPTILVIEKSREIGSHILSGAVVDPRGFDELLEAFPGTDPPYDAQVTDDSLYLLTRGNAFRSPVTPPPLQNHGYYVASLGKLVRWLADLCEQNGVEVYPEFPAVELLVDGDRVTGIRVGDKGRDRDGNPKPNFQPGIDIQAKVTVLGEGARGTLARQAYDRLKLKKDAQPQVYALGVKEVWEVPGNIEAGKAFHTLGYPLGLGEFGGGFLYTMQNNLVSLGFVVGLDYQDPHTDAHGLLQEFKRHPFVRELIGGGKALSYGAKTIPEGGYYSMPRLHAGGLLITGDSAGFVNAQRLKGVHLAVKSGMLAAETIFAALKADSFTEGDLKLYAELFDRSWAREELWRIRNFRQGFQRGLVAGTFHAAAQYVTGGRGFRDPMPVTAGHTRLGKARDFQEKRVPKSDGRLTFNKLEDVFLSDTAHEENQPCHLKILEPDICVNRCTHEYGNPCQHFCPAAVYEITGESLRSRHLRLNFTNCVHCKTCDIMDPYQIIIWTPPEGGGGPDWKNM